MTTAPNHAPQPDGRNAVGIESSALFGGMTVTVHDDGLPPCGDCGKPLRDDWHGLASCFCKWGGREPTIDEIERAADEAAGSE